MTDRLLRVSLAQATEKGLKEENQDSLGFHVPEEPGLSFKGVTALIADGMSGSSAGREASQAAVSGFLSDYYSTPDSWTVKTSVQKILTATNQWLYSRGHQGDHTQYGYVTTLSGVVIKSNTAHLFHVGDSRIYRLRNGNLEQLTRDHRVWTSQEKNYLSRALGIDVHLDIDYKAEDVEANDLFILTTDGIHDFLPDSQLADVVKSHLNDLDQAVQVLIQSALARGSNDNLSAQIVRVEQLPLQSEREVLNQITQLPVPPPLAEGNKIDGYKILREVHASKRSQLYLAIDEATGEKVAIKTPSVNFDDDKIYLESFTNENWVGQRVQSAHVVKMLGQGRKKTFLYQVMEFVSGQTLRQWMQDHPQPTLIEVRDIAEQVVRGLRAFHRLEMLHQDIKPENIMIDPQGVVKIIDFGSVKIGGIAEIASPLQRQEAMGTLDYAAPEYLQGLPGSRSSDIYSLAVIVYEMLTGKMPYKEPMLAKDSGQRDYIPIQTYDRTIPVWVNGALRKALSNNPDKRYHHFSEFLYDLTTPNKAFISERGQPLLERNPIQFWKGLALLLAASNLLLVILLLR